eukprot:COSAG05_NODE_78_length_21399_cov_26.298216_8_plen_55_part_00
MVNLTPPRDVGCKEDYVAGPAWLAAPPARLVLLWVASPTIAWGGGEHKNEVIET